QNDARRQTQRPSWRCVTRCPASFFGRDAADGGTRRPPRDAASGRPLRVRSGRRAGPAAALAERLDARRQTRELARHRVAVEHALGRGAVQLRLRGAERLLRGRVVSAGNRLLHLAEEGAHARAPRLVAGGALLRLADALARGSRVRHGYEESPRTGGEAG